MSKLAVAFFIVLASVQLAVEAHRAVSDRSSLALLTQQTQTSLDSLPARCARRASQLISAQETRLAERLRACAWRHIAFYVSETLTDTAYFSFSAFDHIVTLITDFKKCVDQKNIFKKLICVVEKSSGALTAVGGLITGAISYALELKDLLPDIISEVKQCRESALTGHQRFLDTVLHSARMCQQ